MISCLPCRVSLEYVARLTRKVIPSPKQYRMKLPCKFGNIFQTYTAMQTTNQQFANNKSTISKQQINNTLYLLYSLFLMFFDDFLCKVFVVIVVLISCEADSLFVVLVVRFQGL